MKKKNKKQLEILRDLLTIIPMIIVLAIISRTLPAGDYRLEIESDVGEKAIALTFSDGPGEYTEALLDGLKENRAKASFFVVGKKIEENPQIVKRAYDEGHLIGNLTYDHIRMPFHSLEDCEESIGKTFNLIENVTGERTNFVRAPYGDVSAYQLKKLGVVFVGWSLSTYDWREKDADYIYNRIMKKAKDGDIILLHDTKKETVEAVLRAVPELQEQGYEFVRVDELLARNGEKIKKGTPYRNCKYERNASSF
ncbi:MAG: polysaccharide deacetylase family protein [Clostridia bacterium]|nr:polysaccharide deacetylase family protein [Clostridia bacterium]